MKSGNIIEEYHEYRDKIGNRTELYRIVAKRYGIARALYPGSHIDIAPSLVIPKLIYVDNFKGAINFFKNMELIKEYIDNNKEYVELCDIFSLKYLRSMSAFRSKLITFHHLYKYLLYRGIIFIGGEVFNYYIGVLLD